MKKVFSLLPFLITLFLILLLPIILFFLNYAKVFRPKASGLKANLKVYPEQIIGPLPQNWKALAQGGEEQGVRMLENVIPQVSALFPRYIRIDHIYDFYNVVDRDNNGELVFHWDDLDATVCDIFHTGAKPFFSLGYMPKVISEDGSLIDKPKKWEDWELLVKKTIERYSGKDTRLCGQVKGEFFNNIYYEVWNEPDLETFGKWSLYAGDKDYKTLYFYSSKGAVAAQNVYHFFLGGPVTTAAYKNWFQVFLNYVSEKNLRLDFLSWHHYSKNIDDYSNDLLNINSWLADEQYVRYRSLPKIISEWGYDSNPNPISETNVGAAHTIGAIRNLIEQKLEMAFAFDIKDGPSPRWGFLSYTGEKKPRYNALKMLNLLERYRIKVEGEGSWVKVIGSRSINKISLILVNYDEENKNQEFVPLTLFGLKDGSYEMTMTDLEGKTSDQTLQSTSGQMTTKVLLLPNSVVGIELRVENGKN